MLTHTRVLTCCEMLRDETDATRRPRVRVRVTAPALALALGLNEAWGDEWAVGRVGPGLPRAGAGGPEAEADVPALGLRGVGPPSSREDEGRAAKAGEPCRDAWHHRGAAASRSVSVSRRAPARERGGAGAKGKGGGRGEGGRRRLSANGAPFPDARATRRQQAAATTTTTLGDCLFGARVPLALALKGEWDGETGSSAAG